MTEEANQEVELGACNKGKLVLLAGHVDKKGIGQVIPSVEGRVGLRLNHPQTMLLLLCMRS
eukprot:2148374-Amphidinium_carterae.1